MSQNHTTVNLSHRNPSGNPIAPAALAQRIRDLPESFNIERTVLGHSERLSTETRADAVHVGFSYDAEPADAYAVASFLRGYLGDMATIEVTERGEQTNRPYVRVKLGRWND